jgi:hypothetical protein
MSKLRSVKEITANLITYIPGVEIPNLSLHLLLGYLFRKIDHARKNPGFMDT